MKIIAAVDRNPYSSHAVGEVVKLAANTWANVSILGVQPKNMTTTTGRGTKARLHAADAPGAEMLFAQRRRFLSYFEGRECPYAPAESPQELIEVEKGIYESPPASEAAKKQLTLRLRIGSPGKEILSEAREQESDLIVLGCEHTEGCGWESGAGVPRKVANDASCSVLIVKKKKNVERIICCLDHDRVSQPSLELINQMVTLHDAQLTVVGLAESLSLKAEVEKKMDKILRYYHARGIDPWIELVEIGALDSFIIRESRWGLMALWMGKQSILEKALPRSKVNKLIRGGDASVLILR
jgi:nucleotide-binding universal stress UspA family protein